MRKPEPKAVNSRMADSRFWAMSVRGLVPPEGEVGVGLAAGAAHPAPDLVQLGQAHAVGILNDQGVAVAHVDAGFNQGGADQHVDLAVQQLLPNRELLLGHLAVGNAHPRTRHQLAAWRRWLDGVHPVVQVVHLPAPGQLLFDGLGRMTSSYSIT